MKNFFGKIISFFKSHVIAGNTVVNVATSLLAVVQSIVTSAYQGGAGPLTSEEYTAYMTEFAKIQGLLTELATAANVKNSSLATVAALVNSVAGSAAALKNINVKDAHTASVITGVVAAFEAGVAGLAALESQSQTAPATPAV